jgi:multidrug efflux system membrane fusion protein
MAFSSRRKNEKMITENMKTSSAKLTDPPILPIGDIPATLEAQNHSIPDGHAPSELRRNKPRDPATGIPSSDETAPPVVRWLVMVAIVGIVSVVGYFAYPQLKTALGLQRVAPAPPPARVVPVVTAPVGREDIKLYLNGLGTVNGYNTVTVRSRVEGELVKVAFAEGQLVKQDQLLAEIDSRPYQVQLDQAKARLAEAQAALQKSQHSQAREMAQAQLALDQSQLRLALAEEKRLSELVATKVITADEWDTAVANRQKCEAQVQTTTANLKQAEQDYNVNIQSAQANVAAAATAVRNAELELSYCRIISPISGRIGLRSVDQGNMIRPTDPNGLAVITQLQPIAVIFTIPQDDIAPVQKKMLSGAKLSVDAFDRNFQTKLATGTLEAVDNQVDVATGTVRLKAVFTNENSLLFPNQFVNARLLVDTLPQAVTVPSSAVQRGPGMTYAYVVQPDSTVDLRNIVAGDTEGDFTAIESGLSPGEVVVIAGVDKLQKGSKVAARERGSSRTTGGDRGQALENTSSVQKGS